ncbi:conserved Plasmodium membrane protein, unknown function [Plasmodium sp.]|nr:conserved Plasmodium membrane protein, unknown function [Plasmodium sp.]
MLRSHCNHIVMYGDTRDQALTYSETWNREKCLGKRIFKLKLPLYKIHHYEDYLNINSYGNKFMKQRCKVEQYKVCDSVLFPISSYADEENKTKLKDIDNKDEEKKNKGESKCINKAFKTDKNVLNSYTLDLNDVGEGEGGVSCVSEDVSQNYLNEKFFKNC